MDTQKRISRLKKLTTKNENGTDFFQPKIAFNV